MISTTSTEIFSRSSASGKTQTKQAAASVPDRSFEAIMADYWSDPARGSSIDYLKGLSGEDLSTVGSAHGFANPTPRLEGISLEGANNLLRARGATIDENGDGLDQIGEARIWRFPNSNTPADVASAWEEATAGMEPFEAMLLATPFMPAPMLVTDPASGAQTVVSPGEEGYVNPKNRSGYSYTGTLENSLRALDDPSNPPANIAFYNKQKAFYEKLLEAFDRHSVA